MMVAIIYEEDEKYVRNHLVRFFQCKVSTQVLWEFGKTRIIIALFASTTLLFT